jgi:hypothetical protein
MICNLFWITIQTFQGINFTNQTCLRNEQKYYILPHSFYTNAKIIMHINMLLKTHLAIHLHLLHKMHWYMSSSLQIINHPKSNNRNMLVELCVYNYVPSHRLINWARKTFEGYEWIFFKVYHLGWKGPNPYCNPFFSLYFDPHQNEWVKGGKYFISTIFKPLQF